ncbi:MAG TPA: aminopeptidase [Burkholderiaceae bacterium]|nr:aminopeptidase [Burkholderiaceae bacterium]HMY99638.1 aminopeptidase [Burkholderiaceae bacterium]HNB44183.1 aminopeptidase [Burkholderiaceae bacterium]HNG79448.1 aminopeptidase [Burkholderiaceae bacterium]
MTLRARLKRLSHLLVWVVAALGLSGCAQVGAQVGYYWQSATGHLGLLNAARPVSDWLADPATPPELRERLALSQTLRDYASRELALPDNASYRRYADLKRSAAVWNVVATRELSLELKRWCLLVVGCVGYRGYFDRAEADTLAAQLRAEGWETYVYAVPAYSTLGKLPGRWFADPLLNTFIRDGDVALARLMFHELSHQVAYADGDTVFNESFATAVERIGSAQWLRGAGREALLAEAAAQDRRREDFRALTQSARAELLALYASSVPDDDKRRGKAEILARLRAAYAELKSGAWGGYAGYDRWFASAGNPQLAILGAYNDRVGDFERLFGRVGRDWPRFHAEVRRLADLPKAERDAALALR